MEVIRVFSGYDPRQPLAYNVLQHSIHRHCPDRRVTVEPLILSRLPLTRQGLTQFTFSRFLVPYLCGFEGRAIFMDSDIVVTGNIGELWDQADSESAVQVYQGQQKFEWPSVMLFNNERCTMLTPEYVADTSQNPLMLGFGKIGHISEEWNHCVGYMKPKEAKLYHYTQGLPCWFETKGLPEDGVWFEEYQQTIHSVEWKDLMGRSVHAAPTIERMVRRMQG